VPRLSRVYNYWLGGKDHFAADREVGDKVIASYPDVVIGARAAGLPPAGGSPVAIVLLGILHCLPDEDDPFGIVARLVDAVAPDSYLAISHLASDIDDQATQAMSEYNSGPCDPVYPRTAAEVSRFLDGLDLVDPGLVQVHQWCPWTEDLGLGPDIPNYGAVGRKR
jgi:hypothetical protein